MDIIYEVILNNIIINNIIFLIIRSICIFIYLWICEKWIDEVILQILKNSTSYFSIYFYIIVYVYTYFYSYLKHSLFIRFTVYAFTSSLYTSWSWKDVDQSRKLTKREHVCEIESACAYS